MNPVAYIALIGFPLVVIYLFGRYPCRNVALWSLLIGFLFLPQGAIGIPGAPDYDRNTATILGVLLGAAIYDLRALTSFRPSWIDIPILAFCISPLISSLLNGYGAYDGFSGVLTQSFRWGFPYFIGRVYFSDGPGIRYLVRGLVYSSIAMLVLCVFEFRMGGQVHYWLYGFQTRGRTGSADFLGLQLGAYKLVMDMSLNSGALMALLSLVALWYWMAGKLESVGKLAGWLLVFLLLFVTVGSKVNSAIGALLVCGGSLFCVRFLKLRLVHLLLVLGVFIFLIARVRGWSGQELIDLVLKFNDDFTFAARINNATFVIERTAEKMWFGWGRAAGYRTVEVKALDALWILTYGGYGLFGLLSLWGAMLLPAANFLLRAPKTGLREMSEVAGIGLATLLTAFMIHNLFNAMLMPPLAAAAGGLAGATRMIRQARLAAPGVGRLRESMGVGSAD